MNSQSRSVVPTKTEREIQEKREGESYQDVFVTENNDRDEKIFGPLTGMRIERYMKLGNK